VESVFKPDGAALKAAREARLLSTMELARGSGLSDETIRGMEAGKPCRVRTMRRWLEGAGLPIGAAGRLGALAGPADGGGPAGPGAAGSPPIAAKGRKAP
jgi:DNA-binding transcriptional regulator YiaG